MTALRILIKLLRKDPRGRRGRMRIRDLRLDLEASLFEVIAARRSAQAHERRVDFPDVRR